MNSSTAILFFSHSVDATAKQKQFGMGKSDVKMARTLVEGTKKLLYKSGYSVIEFDEHNQVGASFGARLANAIQSIFTLGYQKVIVVGNDCPDLNIRALNKAAMALEQHNWVIGPTQRGGVYLIGTKVSAFNYAHFLQVDWQTSKVCRQMQRFALCMVLKKKREIHHIVDFIRGFRFSKSNPTIVQFWRLWVVLLGAFSTDENTDFTFKHLKQAVLFYLPFRPPPSLL